MSVLFIHCIHYTLLNCSTKNRPTEIGLTKFRPNDKRRILEFSNVPRGRILDAKSLISTCIKTKNCWGLMVFILHAYYLILMKASFFPKDFSKSFVKFDQIFHSKIHLFEFSWKSCTTLPLCFGVSLVAKHLINYFNNCLNFSLRHCIVLFSLESCSWIV